MTRLVLLLAVGLGASGLTPRPLADLQEVELRLTEVADSQSYYLYSYEVINPAASTSALGMIKVDVSASSGTPANLSTTGDFHDWTASLVGAPLAAHAEVGPITPSGWRAQLTRTAELWWHAPSTRLFTSDSVAAGDTLRGLGIRSSYLPGIATVTARPTVQSCCIEPDTINDVLPGLSAFEVSSSSTVPRYMPSEVDLDLLEGQVDAVCSDPLWIHDGGLCDAFADSLDAAQARDAINNNYGVIAVLDSVANMVLQNAEVIDHNGGALIYMNAHQIIENIVTPSPPPFGSTTLCSQATAPTTSHFTVSATYGDLFVSSPYELEAEVEGVDPPASSCLEVWRMGHGATSLVDVTIRVDSISEGRELTYIWANDSATYAPVDSAVTTHDGETFEGVWFHFDTISSP